VSHHGEVEVMRSGQEEDAASGGTQKVAAEKRQNGPYRGRATIRSQVRPRGGPCGCADRRFVANAHRRS
jgi:hypothetical protein